MMYQYDLKCIARSTARLYPVQEVDAPRGSIHELLHPDDLSHIGTPVNVRPAEPFMSGFIVPFIRHGDSSACDDH